MPVRVQHKQVTQVDFHLLHRFHERDNATRDELREKRAGSYFDLVSGGQYSGSDLSRRGTQGGVRDETFLSRNQGILPPSAMGDGYVDIKVIGRHRGSKQFVTLVTPARFITNWRAKVVYNPEVLGRIGQHAWKNRKEVETMVVVMQTRERLGKSCTQADINIAITNHRQNRKPWWKFW